MHVLIAEGNDLVADLLALIVEGLPGRPVTSRAASLDEAFDLWHATPPDMVLCEMDLPGGSGLAFIKHVRKASSDLPVVIVTDKTDRGSVMTAAKHAVSAYITKPFQVDEVRERLCALAPDEGTTNAPIHSNENAGFPERLQQAIVHGTTLFNMTALADILERRSRIDTLSLADLESAWRADAALQARLIQVANSGYSRRGSDPVASLPGALRVLGTRVALDVALASSLDPYSRLRDETLKAKAKCFLEAGDRIAQTSIALARELGLQESECVAAGMLHRTGELGLLAIAQQYLDDGGTLEQAAIDGALESYSARLSARLKTQFRLPLSLKQLIGATHQVPTGATDVRLPLMRLAALIAQDQEASSESRRLKRRLGINRQFT